MTVYGPDGAGNYFAGIAAFGNHDINSPTFDYLKGEDISNFSADMSTLLTSAGLNFRDVCTQGALAAGGANNNGFTLFYFAPSTDTINDRYAFYLESWNASGTNASLFSRPRSIVRMFNNGGATTGQNHVSSHVTVLTNQLTITDTTTSNAFSTQPYWYPPYQTEEREWSFLATANSSSLNLMMTQTSSYGSGWVRRLDFWHAGLMTNINTGFGYYNASIITQSMTIGDILTNTYNPLSAGKYGVNARHYIANTSKRTLTNGDADFTIVCSDAQTPTATWATDAAFFDNDATLGYPLMGFGDNLLLCQGAYIREEPQVIQGSVFPESPAGNNLWLPIGKYTDSGNLQLFMRVWG